MLPKLKKRTEKSNFSTTKSNIYKLSFKDSNDANNKIWQSNVFEPPYMMTENEMYMVISYLLDYINKITEFDIKMFIKINNILEKIGFFSEYYDVNIDANTIDINENQDWYQKDITIDQIKNIYDRINLFFEISENDIKPSKKMLKKQNT